MPSDISLLLLSLLLLRASYPVRFATNNTQTVDPGQSQCSQLHSAIDMLTDGSKQRIFPTKQLDFALFPRAACRNLSCAEWRSSSLICAFRGARVFFFHTATLLRNFRNETAAEKGPRRRNIAPKFLAKRHLVDQHAMQICSIWPGNNLRY